MRSRRSKTSGSPEFEGSAQPRPGRYRRGAALAAVLFAVALVAGCSHTGPVNSAPRTAALTGDWHGLVSAPEEQLPLGITLTADGGTASIPVQGIYDRPLERLSLLPDAVVFEIPGAPGTPTFHGRYDRAADDISGTLGRSGHQTPLTLHRGEVATPPRPQEPRPPWPYRSEDVRYRSGDITIAGSLTLPNASGPYPAVVLITGSGPQDRDEQIAGHKPFLVLADTLTRAGYAVLRTDDRGVGGTSGHLATSDYTDLTDDIMAGLGYLRGRPDIDGNRIGLAGHSEGGYLAPLAAARPDSRLAFVIMLAGPAVSGSEVLLAQNQALLRAADTDRETVRHRVGYITTLTTLIRSGDREQVTRFATDHNNALPPDRRQPQSAIDELTTPYFDALIDYDPTPALRALRIPVLATYGSKDLQVPAAQSAPAARAALAGDPDAEVRVYDGVNHLLQPADTGSPQEYGAIETTVAPQVLTGVTSWLQAHVTPAR